MKLNLETSPCFSGTNFFVKSPKILFLTCKIIPRKKFLCTTRWTNININPKNTKIKVQMNNKMTKHQKNPKISEQSSIAITNVSSPVNVFSTKKVHKEIKQSSIPLKNFPHLLNLIKEKFHMDIKMDNIIKITNKQT